MHIQLARLGAFLFILLLTFPARAVTFWEDNFENHLYPNWLTDSCGSPASSFPDGCNPSISTDVARSGTHSFKHDLSGSYFGGNVAKDPTNIGQKGTHLYRRDTPTDEVFIRFWYMTVDYEPCKGTLKTASKMIYNKTAGPDAGYWGHWCGSHLKPMSFSHNHQVGPYPYCPRWKGPAASCQFDNNVSNPMLANGVWHCVELNMKFGSGGTSTDGHVRQWVNGVQTMNHTGITLRVDMNPATNKWQSVANFVQGGDQGYRYIDDFAVGNTRIGCGKPIPPPPPPQNLSVQ